MHLTHICFHYVLCLSVDISVVLDLTPNYQGSGPWFSNISVTNVAERLKVSAERAVQTGRKYGRHK